MDRRDAFLHRPTDEEYWSESHYLDAIDAEQDVAVHARLGAYPNRDAVTVFAYVREGDRIYWLRDETIPPAATHGLVVDGGDWTFELEPTSPPEEWALSIDGTVQTTTVGTPPPAADGTASLSLTLDVTSRHEPFYYSDGETFPATSGADRYEVATEVDGSLAVGDRSVAIEGPGERDHSWGRRQWAGEAEWLWISGSLVDGSAFNHLSYWLADHPETRWVNGFWYDGETVAPLTDASLSAEPALTPELATAWRSDAEAAPTIDLTLKWDDGQRQLTVEPGWRTPLEWHNEETGHRGRLNRAQSHQRTADGVTGVGFLEHMAQCER